MKIVWVWHKKIQISKLDIQTRFVSFLPLHFFYFHFLAVRIPPIPQFVFKMHEIKTYCSVARGKIDLKEIDSVHFSYLHWSVVRKKGELNVGDLKVKIGYYHVTPKPIEDLNCGLVRAWFKLLLKWFSPT